MYSITKLQNGEWLVECRIQDGTERWREKSRQEAVHSLISGARVLNHSYIREDDISFYEEQPKPPTVTQGGTVISAEDEKLLSDIKRGAKKVLDFNHYLLEYRITEQEAQMLLDIREGKLTVSRK
jgi:hypothetical protein